MCQDGFSGKIVCQNLNYTIQTGDEPMVTPIALHQPVTQDDMYREFIPIAVIPDMRYQESILAFFGWIPADDLWGWRKRETAKRSAFIRHCLINTIRFFTDHANPVNNGASQSS